MKETYEDLLKAAKANPEGADFTKLRMAYVASPLYNPYRPEERSGLAEVAQGLQGKDDEDALKAARAQVESLLEANYLNGEHHLFAAFLCHRLGDKDRERFHQTFMTGLLKSILASGDGRSYETAFRVIAVQEEYALMKALGLKPHRQELHPHEGHFFDVHRLRHPETGEEGAIFFNIDIPYRWMRDNFFGDALDTAAD